MKIYRMPEFALIHHEGQWHRGESLSFDRIFRSSNPYEEVLNRMDPAVDPSGIDLQRVLPPIESQEVWAAGVTYFCSRDARMEESDHEADVYIRCSLWRESPDASMPSSA